MNTNKHYLKRTLWISSIMLTALLTGCNSSNDSSSEPTVISTTPADGDKAVPLNHKVIATFREAMDSTTIDTQSFSVKAAGEQALSGEIKVDSSSHTASFTPAGSGFTAGTDYTVTLTTAIRSTAGNIVLANNYVWHFTSGTAKDETAPWVTSTTPVDGVDKVVLNRAVTANFSEALDPATVNKATFTLSESVSKTAVSGVVSYSHKVASFTPSSNLASNTSYTATLTTGITDPADLPLAAKTWSFTTGSTIAKGPAPVNLGTAGNFAILSKTGITNTDAHTSLITGNIGSSPITAAAMDNVFCKEIIGTIYGSDEGYTGAGGLKPCFAGTAPEVGTAVLDMGIAYNDAAGRKTPDATNLGAGEIGGLTLAPGLYKWGTDVNISNNVTLFGGENDVWIFQISGDLTMASAKTVILDGVLAENVFWQVGGGVSLNTYASLRGTVLAKKVIAVKTGAAVDGRLLSQTAVTLDQNTITAP